MSHRWLLHQEAIGLCWPQGVSTPPVISFCSKYDVVSLISGRLVCEIVRCALSYECWRCVAPPLDVRTHACLHSHQVVLARWGVFLAAYSQPTTSTEHTRARRRSSCTATPSSVVAAAIGTAAAAAIVAAASPAAAAAVAVAVAVTSSRFRTREHSTHRETTTPAPAAAPPAPAARPRPRQAKALAVIRAYARSFVLQCQCWGKRSPRFSS